MAVEGYQGRKDSKGRSTEFMLLLKRYVEQARELVVLAGPEGTIRVANCDQAGPLLAILGYKLATRLWQSAPPLKPRELRKRAFLDHRLRLSPCRA